ncbi:MAG: hypothetical protein DME49_02600 [Verrucomicrobia bacterium]|nr:MAG: hypothetical protein DME49_02600 [Verrucomicrobiota bacterium]PYK94903.1 MAG: hypothetical protein DME36_03935 [Verrucomicrobiota bacterium]PYL40078.1 MAG: hypothetical protein DMF34_02400 [Verrucomicrobiota bacterium]PYL56128.1 MAG: hypothetical protein DMF30_10825 [Verrucomicrobiota bacterium]
MIGAAITANDWFFRPVRMPNSSRHRFAIKRNFMPGFTQERASERKGSSSQQLRVFDKQAEGVLRQQRFLCINLLLTAHILGRL